MTSPLQSRHTRYRRLLPAHTGRETAAVAVVGCHSRRCLQSADVLLSRHRSRRGAQRWLATVLQRYPGCAAAAAWDIANQRLLVVLRDPALDGLADSVLPSAPGLLLWSRLCLRGAAEGLECTSCYQDDQVEVL
jgi:hypothetical protein